MVKPGVVSSIFRFAGHIPTGMMGFNGLGLYKDAKTLGDIYNVIPHGRIFLQGLKIVGQAGIATFAWNFLMFLGSIPASGPCLVMIGVVDLCLTVSLICGVIMQAKFLPGSYSPCKDAANWHNGTDGRNYFLVANASSKFAYGGPKDTCDAFVCNWQVTLGCIGLYSLCTVSAIVLGCLDDCDSYSRSSYPRSRYPRYSSSHWRDFMDLLQLLFIKPLTYPLNLILPVVRFAVRYSSKFISQGRANRTARARNVEPGRKAPVYGEKPPNLEDSSVLPPQVIRRITKHLHYADLVNVSRSSNRLRTVFFGHGDPAKELDQLRQYCCEGDNKSQCRVCDRQVCESCSSNARNRRSYASQHLRKCRPVCTKCFYLDFCRATDRHRQKRRSKHADSCWSSTEKVDVEEGVGQGWQTADEPICRLCNEKTETARMKRVEAQDTAELQRLAKHPLVCDTCKDPLPSRGPRWWICMSCQVECKSHAHPPWAA